MDDAGLDISLYASERALYHGAREEWEAAGQWLRESFAQSPAGIDYRFLRSGLFTPELEAEGDTLRTRAWQRVVDEAARDPGTPVDPSPALAP